MSHVNPLQAPLGNDVVDLLDEDAREASLHPRFDERAFSPEERAFIGAGPGANARRWSLWAAKEAAHKALRQEEPALGFAPGHYQVRLGTDGQGRVRRGDVEIAVSVELRSDRIHAIAFRGDRPPSVDVAQLDAAAMRDPSGAVRRRLLGSLAPREVALGRADRIPQLRIDGRPVAVSFSHHGRFAAFTHRGEAS